MDWFEHFLEETIAVYAYLSWQKDVRQESHSKKSDRDPKSRQQESDG